MHPLVARIHPSYRTAIVSWFFARAICWLAHAHTGVLALPLLFSPTEGRGAPLWAGWVRVCRQLEHHTVFETLDLGTLVMVGAGELALLAGAVAIYQFARTDELPQTAERATWLWALSPAMALTAPISSWAFAACGVAAALAALESRRWFAATFALAIAIGFRAEAMLIWPGFVWTAYRAYRPEKDNGLGPWLATFGPLASFTGVVGTAMLLAGDYGISLRGLHPDSHWRTELVWDGLAAETPAVILAAGAAVGLFLLLRATVRDAGRGLVAAGPLLVWPLLHQPSVAASGALLLAVPAFVVLARNIDDRSFERPAMVAFTVGLFLMI